MSDGGKDRRGAGRIREGEILEIRVKRVRKDGFGVLRGMAPFTVGDKLKAHE